MGLTLIDRNKRITFGEQNLVFFGVEGKRLPVLGLPFLFLIKVYLWEVDEGYSRDDVIVFDVIDFLSLLY